MEKGAVVGTLTVIDKDQLSGRWRCRCSDCKRRPLVSEEALLAQTARCGCTLGKPKILLPDHRPEEWRGLSVGEKRSRISKASARNTLGYRGSVIGNPTARSVQGRGFFRKTKIG